LGVVVAGVEEVEGELVVGFEAFVDFLEVFDFYAEEGFLCAVVEEDFFVGVCAEGFEFVEDVLGGGGSCGRGHGFSFGWGRAFAFGL